MSLYWKMYWKMSLYFCDLDLGPIFTKCVIYHAFNYMKQKNGHNFSIIFDTMMVWMLMSLTKNALSFIMDEIVVMETSVTSTVSLRFFRYWTGIFACGLHIYVQNVTNIRQQLTILENWPWPKTFRPPALGKIIEPRSNVTNLCDSESN